MVEFEVLATCHTPCRWHDSVVGFFFH